MVQGAWGNSLCPRELLECCITTDHLLVPSSGGGQCGDLVTQAVLPLSLRGCYELDLQLQPLWPGLVWGDCLGITSACGSPSSCGLQDGCCSHSILLRCRGTGLRG